MVFLESEEMKLTACRFQHYCLNSSVNNVFRFDFLILLSVFIENENKKNHSF